MRRVDPAHLAAQIRATADDLARGVLRGDHQLVLEQLQFLVGQVIILWRQCGWKPPPLDVDENSDVDGSEEGARLSS